MLRRLYDWTLRLSESPRAPWALAGVSFAESSFFPIPPDVLLAPMALARPERAFFYAGICTIASVAGGVAGWMIGHLLFDTLGLWLLSRSRFAPGRISRQLKPWGIPRRAVLASWAYLRGRPQHWQPYWRWVVLAEWLGRGTP